MCSMLWMTHVYCASLHLVYGNGLQVSKLQLHPYKQELQVTELDPATALVYLMASVTSVAAV